MVMANNRAPAGWFARSTPPFEERTDCRAYAAPKGLRPRRRVKPRNDEPN